MQQEQFRITGRAGTRAGQYILQPRGPISMASRAAFQEAVQGATGTALIIDLTEVPHIDSSAIGALVQAYVSCQKAGCQLALVGLSHRVNNVLKISSVDILFRRFATLTEAEQALG